MEEKDRSILLFCIINTLLDIFESAHHYRGGKNCNPQYWLFPGILSHKFEEVQLIHVCVCVYLELNGNRREGHSH
jgi:hypothetical protein